MDVIGLGCNCMHDPYWFKFAEHEFKEARSASFRLFQLVFGCVCVWLRAYLGFGFFVTLEFFVLSFG